MSDTIPIHQVGPNCWDIIPRECGGARRAERRAARNNRIECPLNRNARRSRGGALTAMFTRARLYALPYPFFQASPASALLYTVITEFRIFSNPPQQAPAAAPSWARVKRPKKKKKKPQHQLHDANLDSKNRRGEMKSVTVQKTWRARQESFRRCKTQRKIWIVDPQFSRAKHGNHLIGVASRNIWH